METELVIFWNDILHLTVFISHDRKNNTHKKKLEQINKNSNQYYNITQAVSLDWVNKFRQAFEVNPIIGEVPLSVHVINVAKLHILEHQ